MNKIFYEGKIENVQVCNCGKINFRQIDVSVPNKDVVYKICECGNIYTDDNLLQEEQINELLALN